MIEIDVVDSGPGVSEEIQKKIFDSGFSTKIRTNDEGTGMGLSYVKQNVEQKLKGEIELVRASVKTQFRLKLPMSFQSSRSN